jgi:hypothetical protein
MAYEYLIVPDEGEQFNTASIERRARSLPHTLRCRVRGREFYAVTGDEKNLEFVRRLIATESGAAADLAGTITVEKERVIVANPNYTDAIAQTLRTFCAWMLSQFKCHLEDEFGERVTLEDAFGSE